MGSRAASAAASATARSAAAEPRNVATARRRRDPDAGSFYTEYLQAFTFEFDLSRRIMLFNEFVIFWPVSEVSVPGQAYSHAGLHFFLRPNLQVDARAAVVFNAGAADMFGGSGLSCRW